jgi:NDP-sugar pyrophosphorylase family protein
LTVTLLAADPALGSAGTVRARAGELRGGPCVVLTSSAPLRVDLEAVVAAHEAAAVLLTVCVRARGDDERAADVVIAGDDGRAMGVQPAAHPDEALSDVVDAGLYVVSAGALAHIGPGPAQIGADLLPALLSWDAPVHVHRLDG